MQIERHLFNSVNIFVALALGVLALTIAACGSTAAPTPTQQSRLTPTIAGTSSPTLAADYSKLGGSIDVDGSSTVFPITEGVAEEFDRLTRGKVRVTVGISGTGGGFKKFCNGETDIADASRPIKASEAEACATKGIEYIELPVAIDGLAVLVNRRNDFVQCLTVAELRTIWAPEAEGKVNRWNQVRPDWPDQPLRLYGPGVDSGTFDYFTEVINGKAQASRGDYTASEDDNVLVQGVSGDSNSLGYFGYAYYVENQNRMKVVAIDGGSGCQLPTEETINQGIYTPLSRPLFIYVRKDRASQPHIKEFVRYYLSTDGRALVAEVGYIPFPARVYELTLARFEKGTAGTLFGGSHPQKGPLEAVLSANQ
jgi:phosphate transport system substrate-binding protein